MEQLWSAEALRAHWVLSPEELGLLKGMSIRRGLVLGYYMKFFQRYARFPQLSDPVPDAVADFLGEQIGYDGPLPSRVPDRTDRHYRRLVSSSEVASMIEGVLHHGTDLDIDRQFVDTHGQSVVGFAFCHLLGFDLMPRLKGIANQKLARADKQADHRFTNIESICMTRPIDWELIARHYDEMIRLASALKLRTADAETILRRFTRGQTHPVFAALLELGKAVKTIFLCRYLGNAELRREINSGLNVIERWNGVNDFIFYGNGNELVSNRRDDHEISILALHLLQAAMVYVNTLMIGT